MDSNIAGPIFMFSSSSSCNLTVEGNGEDNLKTVAKKPNEVVGGSWGHYPHCNSGVTEEKGKTRTSWTAYIDKHVFFDDHKYNPNAHTSKKNKK